MDFAVPSLQDVTRAVWFLRRDAVSLFGAVLTEGADYVGYTGTGTSIKQRTEHNHHRRLADDDSGGTTPAWLTFLLMVMIGAILFYMLRVLKGISDTWKKKMKGRITQAIADRKAAKDPFRARNGYSYDLVLVFPIHNSKAKLSPAQNENSLKNVLSALADAGLETKQFYSIQNDELYVKVRTPLDRLLREADRIDYKLPLSDVQLGNALLEGKAGRWFPVIIPNYNPETEIDAYKYIYAPLEYDASTNGIREDMAPLYMKQPGNDSIFRGVDRIKLILSIIAARKFEGGAFVDLHKLVRDKCLLGFTPIHDIVELRALEEGWLRFIQAPWRQRVDAVKDYFGEKIGLYFLFLGHYTTWLISAGVAGFISWSIVAGENNDPNAAIVPYFAAFMSVWSTLMLEFWGRKEKFHAMKWGMVGFEEAEQARPQFKGDLIQSPVDGKMFMYFPRNEYMKRIVMSTSIVSGCILVVLGVVTGIFVLKIILTSMRELVVGGTQTGGIIVSIANAVQIQVLNMAYGNIALLLNAYENHRTDTEYEDALIAKTFIFQFINSFSPMFYIAFVKPYIPALDPCLGSCMGELQTSLGTIFMTRLAVGSITAILVPYMNNKAREKANLEGTGLKVTDMSEVERGFMMEEYHVMLGPFADYANISIQFGYTTMFVVAFPLATCIALLCNYIEMRIGAWKLCQLCRRPEPRNCEDIGTWGVILDIIAMAAAVVNAGLIVFTSNITMDYTWNDRVWLFFIIALILLSIKFVIKMATPDVPVDVDIQLKRAEFFLDKVMYNKADEDDSLLTKNIGIDAEYVIRITDDDPL